MKQFKRLTVLLLIGLAITAHTQNPADIAAYFEQLPSKK